jgi:hypothetical protein
VNSGRAISGAALFTTSTQLFILSGRTAENQKI